MRQEYREKCNSIIGKLESVKNDLRRAYEEKRRFVEAEAKRMKEEEDNFKARQAALREEMEANQARIQEIQLEPYAFKSNLFGTDTATDVSRTARANLLPSSSTILSSSIPPLSSSSFMSSSVPLVSPFTSSSVPLSPTLIRSSLSSHTIPPTANPTQPMLSNPSMSILNTGETVIHNPIVTTDENFRAPPPPFLRGASPPLSASASEPRREMTMSSEREGPNTSSAFGQPQYIIEESVSTTEIPLFGVLQPTILPDQDIEIKDAGKIESPKNSPLSPHQQRQPQQPQQPQQSQQSQQLQQPQSQVQQVQQPQSQVQPRHHAPQSPTSLRKPQAVHIQQTPHVPQSPNPQTLPYTAQVPGTQIPQKIQAPQTLSHTAQVPTTQIPQTIQAPQTLSHTAQVPTTQIPQTIQAPQTLSHTAQVPGTQIPQKIQHTENGKPPIKIMSPSELRNNSHVPSTVQRPELIPGYHNSLQPESPPCFMANIDFTDLTAGLRITGMDNLGNTCWMNSVIQCLSATVPFSHFFLSRKYREQVVLSKPFTEAFYILMNQLWKNHRQLLPVEFMSIFRDRYEEKRKKIR
eukprot:TRINITY_DN3011_c0_g1_i1.p1 TRINITY_DN3011_c0_g1~~TRINITY_DN3011_c0_g1_i1.p1  ORF type:complete len:672 (+),score=111.35 TRINITY_DN3011_c0_g1_i1:287-2017(+)